MDKVLVDEQAAGDELDDESSREEQAPKVEPKANADDLTAEAKSGTPEEAAPETKDDETAVAPDEEQAREPSGVAAEAGDAEVEAEEEAGEPPEPPETAAAPAAGAEPETSAVEQEETAVQPEAGEAEPESAESQAAAEVEAEAEEAAPEPKKKKARAKGTDGAALPTTDEELFQPGRSWYVVHTYSGYEDKVRTNLEQRIKSMDAEDLVFRVVVPSVEEMEIRDGQRRTVPKKIFPGYVLVQMITLREEDTKTDEAEMARSNKAWMVVRNSPGVTGFVGSGTAPTPLDKEEVLAIMKQMRAEEPVVKVGFNVGQSVRVIDGPFADFVGVVDEINVEKGKVKVLVSMMGRETPVELDFLQVERL